MSFSVNSLTEFIFESISSDSTIVSSGVNVFRETMINEDINTVPAVYVLWGGSTTNQENSGIGNPNLMRPWNIQVDYTFYLQQGNFNRNPRETVQKLDNLWDYVYSAVIFGIVNSSETALGCSANIVSWSRVPDLRSTTDLKNNRQTIYSDAAQMTFQVYG